MTTFERGFADVERAATAAAKASGALVTVAKQMQKASLDGDIAKIRKASERLTVALDAARQEVANARSAWPFTPEEEEVYLRDEYERELLDVAGTEGLQIRRHDERLVVFPSVIRILPAERAVKIDRNRVPTVRPSKLVAILKVNQTKKPRFGSERFLEALYRAYHLLTGKKGAGTTVPLYSIYEAFTLPPGATTEYNNSDFGRDLFLLDRSGLTQTKSGAEFSLPASTGVKEAKAKKIFLFVAPDGETVTYYGIRFTEINR
ncbi:MAG: hypothetical protein ACYC2T_05495 [Bacillota bacterium]